MKLIIEKAIISLSMIKGTARLLTSILMFYLLTFPSYLCCYLCLSSFPYPLPCAGSATIAHIKQSENLKLIHVEN